VQFTPKYTNNQLVMPKNMTCAVVQNLCSQVAQQKMPFTVSKTHFLGQLCRLCRFCSVRKYLVQLVQKRQDNNFTLYIYCYLQMEFCCTTAQLVVNDLIYCKLQLCKPLHNSAQVAQPEIL
jgi:ammonia channel protein AmtB